MCIFFMDKVGYGKGDRCFSLVFSILTLKWLLTDAKRRKPNVRKWATGMYYSFIMSSGIASSILTKGIYPPGMEYLQLGFYFLFVC